MATDAADKFGEMFEAIEAGDMARLRSCFEPDALTWHNVDEVAKNLDAVTGMLGAFCALSTSRAYEERRTVTLGNVAFSQHVLTATLRNGQKLRIPAMMRLETSKRGLVARLEEYYDSRATDVLATQEGPSGDS